MRAKTNIENVFVKAKPAKSIECEVGSDQTGYIKFKYVLPADSKRKGYIIKIKEGGYPANENDGITVYDDQNVTRNEVSFTYPKTGYTDGTTYYVRIFTYTYKNADIVYTYKNAPQCTVTPICIKGIRYFTTSTEFEIPELVNSVDIFMVGGGSGGCEDRGGNGGYTRTEKNVSVSGIDKITIIIGAGGNGGTNTAGGETKVLVGNTIYTSAGGQDSNTTTNGGGSGGGGTARGTGEAYAGYGGSDGNDGENGTKGWYTRSGGKGQKTTTKEFGEESGTKYGGGGGGFVEISTSSGNYEYIKGKGNDGGGDGQVKVTDSSSSKNIPATDGTDGTGSGGGAGQSGYAGKGGTGVVIIRWGY